MQLTCLIDIVADTTKKGKKEEKKEKIVSSKSNLINHKYCYIGDIIIWVLGKDVPGGGAFKETRCSARNCTR